MFQKEAEARIVLVLKYPLWFVDTGRPWEKVDRTCHLSLKAGRGSRNLHDPTNQVPALWASLSPPPSCPGLVHILVYQVLQALGSAQPSNR